MNKHLKIISKSILFRNINLKEIENILFYLHPKIRKYKQGSIIFQSGDKIEEVGIVLSGKLQVVKYDPQGERIVICLREEGELFAETFALAELEQSPSTVIAEKDSEIMFIKIDEIISAGIGNEIAGKFIKNMMAIISMKIIYCIDRFCHLANKTARRKLLSYFNELAARSGSKKFVLPFSKTILADYLFLDRSAMMRELRNMKRDGIIDFTGSHFEIK